MRNETLYISTYLGNRFYPLERRIDRVELEDIAHGLAFQCRFNGQTRAFYSVAQHSLMVASLVPPHQRRAALLHDACEAYLGDVVKPLKPLLGAYRELEEAVTRQIAETFGVAFDDYRAIKRADLIALATEKRDLMPHSTEAWSYLAGVRPLPEPIVPMTPMEAKQAFLEAWSAFESQLSLPLWGKT
jgi:5'-deoxynucleotidase YfbR-like HD superfamily hydrolase